MAPKVRGDALDDVFGGSTAPVLYYEQLLPQETKANENVDTKLPEGLDPLGWPVAPAVFRNTTAMPTSTTSATTNPTTTLTLSYDDDHDDDDDDALNLLKQNRSDHPSNPMDTTTAMGDWIGCGGEEDDENNQVTGSMAHDVWGVEIAATDAATSVVVGYHVAPLTKEARIQQYETTGIVDDESSVESNSNDAEEEEEDDEVNYMPQDYNDDDDDSVNNPIQPTFASFDTECHGATMWPAVQHANHKDAEVVAQTTTAMAQFLVLDDTKRETTKTENATVAKMVALPSSPKKKKVPKEGTKGASGATSYAKIPLLRPPPPEKMAAWEASRRGASPL